jgi:hypothetical protein
MGWAELDGWIGARILHVGGLGWAELDGWVGARILHVGGWGGGARPKEKSTTNN